MAKNKEIVEESVQNEEQQPVETKPKFGQKIKTAAENVKLDAELFWARNKKKVLVGVGVIGGAALGVLGLKAYQNGGCEDLPEDGESTDLSEIDDAELLEESETQPESDISETENN